MKIEKHTVSACCGKTNTTFKVDKSITKDILLWFKQQGFNEIEHFTKAGMLYVENDNLILTSPFGSNKLQAKCKKTDCVKILNDFEDLLKQLE